MKARSTRGTALAVALVAVLSALAATTPSLAQQNRISITTGGTGGVYYPLGGGMANVLSKNVPGLQATAEVTGGSVDNLKLIGAGKSEVAFTMADIYPSSHWAIRGVPPAYDTPDEDVYLIGRNLVLLTKAATWCAANKVSRIVLGPLAGNPFPDATPEFFASMAHALSLGLAQRVEIEAPFRNLHKEDVVKLGLALGVPFEQTLSCMNPKLAPPGGAVAYLHCGACSKCRERIDAFAAAGVADPAPYAAPA